MNAIEIAILAALGLGVVAAWTYVLFIDHDVRPEESYAFPVAEWEEISAHHLGQIEGSIKGLLEVIVAAHRIEEPTNNLRAAVARNFERRVQYTFLVSNSSAEEELNGWVHMFLTIAHVILKRSKSDLTPSYFVTISKLSYDWRNTPFVFYRAKNNSGELATIAFQGNQNDEGIAERYVRLPADIAYSLALAILSDAPSPIQVTQNPFLLVPQIDQYLADSSLSDEPNYEHTE